MNETTRPRTANEAEALRLWNSLSERNKGIAMVLMETVVKKYFREEDTADIRDKWKEITGADIKEWG